MELQANTYFPFARNSLDGCEQISKIHQSKCGENLSKVFQEKLQVELEFEKPIQRSLAADTTVDSGCSFELSFEDSTFESKSPQETKTLGLIFF